MRDVGVGRVRRECAVSAGYGERARAWSWASWYELGCVGVRTTRMLKPKVVEETVVAARIPSTPSRVDHVISAAKEMKIWMRRKGTRKAMLTTLAARLIAREAISSGESSWSQWMSMAARDRRATWVK